MDEIFMPLPDKSTLIGANVTEQGFKTALGEFVDNASSKEDAKSKADAAQANAISAAAIDAKSKADAAQANAISAAAIDAKSKADAAQANAISAAATDAKSKADAARDDAIDAAEEYVEDKFRKNNDTSLFDFMDIAENKVVRFLRDGDIETAKFGKLSEFSTHIEGQAKTYTDEKTKAVQEYTDEKTKALNTNLSSSLFDFNDLDGSIVAQLLSDGDLNLAALDGRGVAQLLKLLLSLSANANDDSSIFNLYDSSGHLAFKFTDSGDIIFNGGDSLKAITSKENSSVIKIPSRYELFTNTFASIISSYQNLSHISALPIPTGLCSQKFKISDKQAFLNLKIAQPERIKIDTPYYRDDHVVHPFLCNFYKTFRGFNHILLLTPYHDTDANFENPCVYGSNDLLSF
ncbi:hypothetical protein ACFODO_23850, partial [Acinetobacter sichuanensis]